MHALRKRRKSLFEAATRTEPVAVENKKKGIDVTHKIGPLNDLRSEKLFMLFSRQFLAMAKSSNEFNDHVQAHRYLHYAENMLELFKDEELNCPHSFDNSEIDDLNVDIMKERDVTRQGLHFMLSNSHKITENLEIKLTHTPPQRQNWELKKAPVDSRPNFIEQQETKLSSPMQKEWKSQPKEKVTKFPKTPQYKSMTELNEPTCVRGILNNNEEDQKGKVLTIFSDGDEEPESTDL